ncbi:hypothetical protein A3H38_05070 [candidate division WOR-1 bacterium RIFCSPLOWO2_02_FULL_46_20]|uniref:Uncharacterized protein n=1 Tax=candidate division WOR-1 bacterium RIFCSPLOWO2_02_FULL_46_20 TaxID=1802567 RepID=A0A1F4R4K3_UNCSA|nr:MAG: hypothetical protein A3H38_05070 [candidate division WOR-1 bacterium RIFCSPLOWO2_02_FULL_46_20]
MFWANLQEERSTGAIPIGGASCIRPGSALFLISLLDILRITTRLLVILSELADKGNLNIQVNILLTINPKQV